jgi:predicted nucleic acid-binding protein
LTIYADSSFFVSLYVPNQHFKKAQRLVPRHAEIWFTPLHRAEWAHALAQHLLQGRISDAQAQAFRDHLERDRQSRFWSEVALPERAFDRCIQIVQQHSRRLPMATLDTLHIACALELGAERFYTFDERQAKLAQAVGLKASPKATD